MARRDKYDWRRLAELYVTGDMTLAQLAQSENVPLQTINRRSSTGNWVGLRQRFRTGESGEVSDETKDKRREVIDAVRELRAKVIEDLMA